MDCHCWTDTHTFRTKTSSSRVIQRVDLNSWSVDPQRTFIGVYPRPINPFICALVIDVHVSMSRVDNFSSGHEVQNGKSPSPFIYPLMFSGTVRASAPYPTPIGVHLSTRPVDKSSPVNYNDMMRENTSNPSKFLPSVNPLCENPYMQNPSLLINPIDLLCHRSSRYLTFTVV